MTRPLRFVRPLPQSHRSLDSGSIHSLAPVAWLVVADGIIGFGVLALGLVAYFAPNVLAAVLS